MAWYRTGTITVTNGSATITGSGTAFIANASIGEGLIGPDGRTYEITNIASDTSLTISPAYLGGTAGGQAYAIAPLRGRIADLISETSSLLASFSSVRDGIGAGLFPDGSAATPGFRFANDQDTGIFRSGENQFSLVTGGSTRATFTANGTTRLGGVVKLEIANGSDNNSPGVTLFEGDDFLYNGQYLHQYGFGFHSINLGGGNVNSPYVSGFFGVSFFSAGALTMRLAPNGNVGIGATLPASRLHVAAVDQSVCRIRIENTLRSAGGAMEIVGGVNALSQQGLSVFDTSAGLTRLVIGDNGNVGIGSSAPTAKLEVNGTVSAGAPGVSNNTFGVQLWPIAAGSAVYNLYCAGDNTLKITNGGNTNQTLNTSFIEINANASLYPSSDNIQILGTPEKRWSVVYAGSGTINTSDEREKHWRGELTAAEMRAAKRIIAELGIYQWNDAVAEKGEDSARLHFGVRAQQAFSIMEEEGLDWGRYAWACYDQWEEKTEPVMEEVTVTKTRKVMQPSETLDEETGEPIMVEVEQTYEETEMQPTGETRVTLEAGDRHGVRPDQLAFWLIAAQAAMQADLEARIALLEGA